MEVDPLLAWIEKEAEEEMSKYVSYDGPMEADLERLMGKALVVGLREALAIATTHCEDGSLCFSAHNEAAVIRGEIESRISALSQKEK